MKYKRRHTSAAHIRNGDKSRIRVFAALRQMAHELLCLGIFPVGVREYALDAIDNLVQRILACHKRAVDCFDFLLYLIAFFIKRAVKSDFADKVLHILSDLLCHKLR